MSKENSKLDVKDKAIKMFLASFEKRLKQIEKLACREITPEMRRRRTVLLSSLEEYLRELLIS